MKKTIYILCSMLLMMTLLIGCGSKTESTKVGETSNKQDSTTSQTKNDSKDDKADADEELLSGKHHVEIVMEDYGTIKAELDADVAPITVTNFINLANEGFYDGLTFHRVYAGFMIQGGDPQGNGYGGSDAVIKGEFSANGVENNMSHVRGTISMARSQSYDSASSQFFIVHEDSTFLDGDYAAFGTVTEGMEIVDQICEKTPVVDGNGTVDAHKQPVIKAVIVVD